jgi:hypothetical protein
MGCDTNDEATVLSTSLSHRAGCLIFCLHGIIKKALIKISKNKSKTIGGCFTVVNALVIIF